MALLENKCPQCHEGPIMRYLIKLNEECEVCGYRFEREPGAFTGALYLNLTLVGLSTFPFFCLLLIPTMDVFSVAVLTLTWVLMTSPFTLRFSKILWAKLLFKQSKKVL